MPLQDFLNKNQFKVPTKQVDSSLSGFLNQRGITPKINITSENSLSNFLQGGKQGTPNISSPMSASTPSTLINQPTKKESTLTDAFRYVGKQLTKPLGVAAKEMRGIGGALGSLMAIASPKVSAEKGIKLAAKEIVNAQKGAWNVLKGDEETSFSKEIAKSAQESGKKLDALDKTMSIASDFVLDPMYFIKPVKIAKEIGHITKLEKPVKFLADLVKNMPEAKKLATIFTNTTGNPEFDAIVSKFRNLRAARDESLIEDAVSLQKNIKKLGAGAEELITEGLENVKSRANITNPQTLGIIENLEHTYKGLLDTAKSVGLKVGEIMEYAPHIRTKESFADKMINKFGIGAKEFGTAGVEKGRKLAKYLSIDNPDLPPIFATAEKGFKKLTEAEMKAKDLNPLGEFFKDTIGNIYEKSGATIKELGEHGIDIFEKNPAIQLVKKGQAFSKAITSKEFANAIEKFAIPNGVAVKNPILKGLKFKPEITAVIDNFYQGIKPDELNVVIKTFDKVQNLWKAQALVSPSYHIRNMAGNIWNNYLAGVNPWAYGKAGLIQKGILKDEKLVQQMKDLGVINQGWYAKDIGEEVMKRVDGIGNWKAGLNPIGQENYLFRLNKGVGSVVENNARIAHYLSKLAEGMTPEKAAKSVKKYLFDYGNLTSVEKNIFKRVVPFYTWTRKNIPLQLSELISQPGKFTLPTKIVNMLESGVEVPNERYMGPYISENVPVRVKKDKNGNTMYFLLGNWLPYASALDVLSHPLDTLSGMASPVIKNPYEYLSNKSTFFKDTLGNPAEIERKYKEQGEFMGQLVRKKNIQLLSNIRILNDLNKLIDKQDPTAVKDSWPVKLMNVLFGKAATYDVEKAKYFYDQDMEDRISDLKNAIKTAEKKGYKDQADKLRQEIQDFIKMRKGND